MLCTPNGYFPLPACGDYGAACLAAYDALMCTADSCMAKFDGYTADVVGPASAVCLDIAVFNSTTGKLLANSGYNVAEVMCRANHTGTQAVSTISDFTVCVNANACVAANTAKVTNACHTGEVTGDGALTIANNVVDEANLKMDEAPTNDYVITADSTCSGGMKWAAAASGFADPMTTRGDIIVRNASNETARLAIGTAGQMLCTDGTDIGWATVAASGGDVCVSGTPSAAGIPYWVSATEVGYNACLTYNNATCVLMHCGTSVFGRTDVETLTANELVYANASKTLTSAAVATYPSLTELAYVKGVTSAIQSQMNAKAPVADPTFTGEIGIGSVNVSETELGILEGATVTTTELNYVDGVTSSIQTQIDNLGTGRTEDTVSTTDATETTVETIATASNKAYHINVIIVGRQTNSANETNSYTLDFSAKNNGGTVTLGTIQNTYTDEDVSDWSVTADVDGTDIDINVTGAASDNINWKSSYVAVEV